MRLTQNLVYSGVNSDGTPIGTPDGTYSFTISALATDRQGNPVVPGTTIQFGVIDAPLAGFPGLGGGTFQIAGNDGNPLEGGATFTAPGGQFTTAGGGAGPGDTLLVFGDLVTGNSDLENVRLVQSVNSATNITTTSAFNRNDTTGTSVNYGNVLPYVIGRATEANITASASNERHRRRNDDTQLSGVPPWQADHRLGTGNVGDQRRAQDESRLSSRCVCPVWRRRC